MSSNYRCGREGVGYHPTVTLDISAPYSTSQPRLADLTTFHVGGPVRDFVVTHNEGDFIAAIRAADVAGTPLLVLGGGSNLVAGDGLFDGVVVHDERAGHPEHIDIYRHPLTPQNRIRFREDHESAQNAVELVTMVAGQDWDKFVASTVKKGLAGVEALSGIPGTVGAAPVQNIGAYGQDVSQTIQSVRVYDRETGDIVTFSAPELEFGYRSSKLKSSMMVGSKYHPTPRYVVLDVTFALHKSDLSMPIAYAQLANRLGVAVGERAPLPQVRDAVLELRAGKGMLAPKDEYADDHNRWSAGSFFTNPILDDDAAATLPADAPRFQHGDQTKTSAAWLIEHAGFTKGYGVHGPDSKATLSTKHTLALTNRGAASAADITELARDIRAGVHEKYGITLEPEPVTIGFTL